MHTIEITWYKPEGDDTIEEKAPTLERAIFLIEFLIRGRGMCRAWLDNKPMILTNGKVMGPDGAPYCTNERWHHLVGYPKEPVKVYVLMLKDWCGLVRDDMYSTTQHTAMRMVTTGYARYATADEIRTYIDNDLGKSLENYREFIRSRRRGVATNPGTRRTYSNGYGGCRVEEDI